LTGYEILTSWLS